MNGIWTTAIVFYGFYCIIKEFLDFFLKKKIINSGHFEKAEILGNANLLSENTENQKYPSLKWGLVALFGGIGLIVSSYVYNEMNLQNLCNHFIPGSISSGILLVFISLGFLVYFLIVMNSKRK